nr:hypothetical protein [Candidatus Gracilibacteria bacterium]
MNKLTTITDVQLRNMGESGSGDVRIEKGLAQSNGSIENISDDKKWIEYLKLKLEDSNLYASQIAYINRIIRVYEMPNLASIPGHPIQMVIDRIVKSNFFK